MRVLSVFVLIMVFTLLATGCKEDENLVPADKFSDIYVDLLKTQDSIGTAEILIKPALDSLLKKHGVSRPLYDSTVQFYMRNPEQFRDFMTTVREKVATLKPEKPGQKPAPEKP